MPAFLVALIPVIFAALRIFMIANVVGLIMRVIVALGVNAVIYHFGLRDCVDD